MEMLVTYFLFFPLFGWHISLKTVELKPVLGRLTEDIANTRIYFCMYLEDTGLDSIPKSRSCQTSSATYVVSDDTSQKLAP